MGHIPVPVGARFPSLVLRASAPSALPALRNLPRTLVTKSRPIHLVELCGGICAFLEAFLRNGYRIQRYTYCDTDIMARSAARHRLWLLHTRDPRLLPRTAFLSWDTALPHDVHSICACYWSALPPVDVIAAGPPCQSFSSAGP